jgi:hypothetical protein
MDAFLRFMTSDTTLFGFNIHNWIVALAGLYGNSFCQELVSKQRTKTRCASL